MARLVVNPHHKMGHINKDIYGHFAEHLGRCIYEGLYVGEDSPIPNKNGMRTDVVEALKEMKIPVLRWPGGCFADEYHWMDGIGPKESRKRMVNTHWGGVVEDNSFGTHEYFELCDQLGCDTYVNLNLGSGTVQEMSEWIEYMTFEGDSPMANLRRKNGREEPWKIKYVGVGNENWGCGGNMTPEHYANEYRRYQTYVRDYRTEEEKKEGIKPGIKKICCGANVDDYGWTEGVLETCFAGYPRPKTGHMDGLSLHYYVHPEGWKIKGSATDFDEEVWYKTLAKALYTEKLIERHGTIMDKYDPKKKIGMIVDEWGNWFKVEPGTNPGFLYQQNTMRDALVAGIHLNIFNKHCDRVKMANIAQMVNVLQAVILTEGEKMIKTPTYYVFHMYRFHQDAELVESSIESEKIGADKWQVPNLQESASVAEDGTINITVNNLSADTDSPVELFLTDTEIHEIKAEIVTNEMHAMNTFENPDVVTEVPFTEFKQENGKVSFVLPACSVMHIAVK